MTLGELRQILEAAIVGTDFADVSYFAGGCVRDQLLAEKGFELPRDVEEADIAVEMAEGGEALAQYLHRVLETSRPVLYRAFGTASLLYRGLRLEFVMTRSESYRQRDRKPSVRAAELASDARRRDFGINALYMKICGGEVLDPTGRGREDLERGLLRCVGSPEEVFAQDPLRLLRAIRFSAKYAFPIEENSWEGIRKAADSIRHISIERIADEVRRVLCFPDPDKAAKGIALLKDSGILAYILPELAALSGLTQNKYHHLDAFEHSLEVLRNTHADICLRWAALLHDIGKAASHSIGSDGSTHFYGHEQLSARLAEPILKRYGILAAKRASIVNAIGGHMLFKQSGEAGNRLKDATLRRYQHRFGEDLELLLDLCHADNLAHHPQSVKPQQIPGIRARLRALEAGGARFSLTGKDIMRDFGISEGIIIGEMLNYARDTWFEHPELDKRELLKRVGKKFKKKEQD